MRWWLLVACLAAGCGKSSRLDGLSYRELADLLHSENARLDRAYKEAYDLPLTQDEKKMALNRFLAQIARRNTVEALCNKAWEREKTMVEYEEPESYEHFKAKEKELIDSMGLGSSGAPAP